MGKTENRVNVSFQSEFVSQFPTPYSKVLRGGLLFVVLEKLDKLETRDYFIIGEYLKKIDEMVKRGNLEKAKEYKEELIGYLEKIGSSGNPNVAGETVVAEKHDERGNQEESREVGESATTSTPVNPEKPEKPEEPQKEGILDDMDGMELTVDME